MEVVNTTSTTDPVNMYNFLNSYMLNPIIFSVILLIIIIYYMYPSSSSLGNYDSDSGDVSNVFGTIMIIILIIFILVNAFQYFFSLNVTAYIQGLFTPKTNVDIVVDQSKYQPLPSPSTNFQGIKMKRQVFNIPGNHYTYDDAKTLCKAYNAELADYDQIERAYKNGAEWCNYGWSANQMALFPTQKQTYERLQNIKGHEHDCGRTGINGGYIENKNVKFGVNCYGYKPQITNEEEELMKIATPYPETQEDIEFQKRVNYWKNNLNKVLISPFNYNTWSEGLLNA